MIDAETQFDSLYKVHSLRKLGMSLVIIFSVCFVLQCYTGLILYKYKKDDVKGILQGQSSSKGCTILVSLIMLPIIGAYVFKSQSSTDSNIEKMSKNFNAINTCADQYTTVSDYTPRLNEINDKLSQI